MSEDTSEEFPQGLYRTAEVRKILSERKKPPSVELAKGYRVFKIVATILFIQNLLVIAFPIYFGLFYSIPPDLVGFTMLGSLYIYKGLQCRSNYLKISNGLAGIFFIGFVICRIVYHYLFLLLGISTFVGGIQISRLSVFPFDLLVYFISAICILLATFFISLAHRKVKGLLLAYGTINLFAVVISSLTLAYISVGDFYGGYFSFPEFNFAFSLVTKVFIVPIFGALLFWNMRERADYWQAEVPVKKSGS